MERIGDEAVRQTSRSRSPCCGSRGPASRAADTSPICSTERSTVNFPTGWRTLNKCEVSETAAEPARGAGGHRRTCWARPRRAADRLPGLRLPHPAVGGPDRAARSGCWSWQQPGRICTWSTASNRRPNLADRLPARRGRDPRGGVPWFMEVAVQNFGPAAAQDVPVRPQRRRPRPAGGHHSRDSARAGSVKERFSGAVSAKGGWHAISARLESDAVAADNYRYCVIDLPADLPVLLVDGDANATRREIPELALGSGRLGATGMQPPIETPRYLSTKPLGGFPTINLAEYRPARQIGGHGPGKIRRPTAAGSPFSWAKSAKASFSTTSCTATARGFFPLPLEGPAELLVDRLGSRPDVHQRPATTFHLPHFRREAEFVPAIAAGAAVFRGRRQMEAAGRRFGPRVGQASQRRPVGGRKDRSAKAAWSPF